MDTTTIIQSLFNGIAVGSIIALAAVGLTLTLDILRLSNFAHGDFLTVGAYLAWWVNGQGINIWLSMILAALGTIIVMLLSELGFCTASRSLEGE